jgi:anaerobic magnesium-protoporphyrin IX monomethyl ester cyclase
MKILLIDTQFNTARKNDPPRVYLSQAQLFLATSLNKNGFQVSVYDPKVSCKKNFNKELGIFYVGDSFDEIEERVRQEKPDMVGITNLFSKDFNNAVEIASRVKKVNPGIKTIVGGFHSTLAPEDFLKYSVFDFAVMGEGERTVVEIAKEIEKQNHLFDIEGLAYRNSEKIIIKNKPGLRISSLDDLGFPDYSLVNLEKYFKINSKGLGARPLSGGQRSISVITSRGCPYKCFFCNANKIHGYKFRFYSAKVILAHIHRLINEYKIDYIEFEDDNLSFNRTRFKEIVKGLCDLEKRIKWGTPNGVRADTLLDRDLIKLVKKSGCEYITVGVESGNQEFLNRVIKKRLDLKHVVELASLSKEEGLPMNAFFIIGFPHEKLWQIRETLEFAMMLNKKYDVYPFINFAIPIKGTEMYDECVKNGFLTEEITPKSLVESASFRGSGKIITSEFTPESLSGLMEEFNKHIFRNSLIKGIRNPLMGFRFAKSALRNFSHFKRYVLG